MRYTVVQIIDPFIRVPLKALGVFVFSAFASFMISIPFILKVFILTPYLLIGGLMIVGSFIWAEVVNSQCEKEGL